MWIAAIIFTLTYLALAIGHIPKYKLDRTGMALVGAAAMLVSGVISLPQAYQAIDGNTILLLFAMMIVAAYIRLAKGFRLVAYWILRRIYEPVPLLAATIFISGILSAFFVNDIICLVLTPLIIEMVSRLKLPAIPYLVAVATSSNIGSAASAVGNPQNILIASLGNLSFREFLLKLGPIALIGLALNFLVVYLIYRSQLKVEKSVEPVKIKPLRYKVNKAVLIKSGVISFLMLIAFLAGVPLPLASSGAAAMLLITRRVNPSKVYRFVDWELLMLFAGLFVLVQGVEVSGLMEKMFSYVAHLPFENIFVLSSITIVLSNIVSNVPAVLLLKPIILELKDVTKGWYFLAMVSTLAGNLTILGSVANLIVVQIARRENIKISFMEYLKVGLPVTLITILVGLLFFSFY
ncbi:MAG: anion transporter [Blastocatellia bacterium]|nr:anion transporter [Blastocatellia bacterium]